MRTYPKGKPPIRYAPTEEIGVYYAEAEARQTAETRTEQVKAEATELREQLARLQALR